MRVEKKLEENIQKPGLTESTEPQPISKILVLAAFAVLATGLFWFLLANILEHGISFSRGSNNVITLVWILLVFCLMFAIVSISAVTVRNSLWFLLIAIASSLTYFVFLRFNIWAFGPVILLILAFLYWRREIRLDMKSRIKFLPKKLVGVGLHAAMSIALLAVGFSYYAYMVQGHDGSTRVMESMVNISTSTINRFLPMVYNGYSPRMTLDEFIGSSSVITSTTVSPGGAGEPQRIMAEALSTAQKKVVEESRDQFLKTFDIEATGDEPMKSVVEKIVRKRIEPFLKPYIKYIPIIFALSLYFLLSIFLFLYKIFIQSFSFIIFTILRWLKFVQIKKVQVEAERITL